MPDERAAANLVVPRDPSTRFERFAGRGRVQAPRSELVALMCADRYHQFAQQRVA
jgi:hypothetical protein